MPNEIVKPHTFEVAKNKIQTLAHNVPSTVSLKQFPTEGSIFSWNDHNITGNEANSLLVSPLQTTLITQNSNIRSLYNIADEVYKALESLDKEYISGIIAAVKSAEIASNQAKTASSKAESASEQALVASNRALDASKKANNAQADIKRTVEALKTTVQVLKEFKEKVTKELDTIQSLNNQINTVNQVLHIENSEGKANAQIEFISEVKNTHVEIKESLRKLEEVNDTAHLSYEKRIKTAYYVGGSAVGLSIINYILQILGIL